MIAREKYYRRTGLPCRTSWLHNFGLNVRRINLTLFTGRENWLCCQSGQSYAAALVVALPGVILLLALTAGQKRSGGRRGLPSWPEMYSPKTLRCRLQLVFWRRMAWFKSFSFLLEHYEIWLNLIFLTNSSTLLLSTSGKKKFSLHLQIENDTWKRKWNPGKRKMEEMETYVRNSRSGSTWMRKYLSSPPLTEAARLRLGDEAGPLRPAAWRKKKRLKICSEDWQNLNCGSACWSWTSRLQRVLFSVPWGFLKTWEHAIQQILLSKIPPDIKDCPSSLKLRELKTAKMKHVFLWSYSRYGLRKMFNNNKKKLEQKKV